MAKPDKEKVDNAQKQSAKMQAQIQKMHVKLQDPDLSEEELASIQEAIDDFQAKIDRLAL